jgi:amino acid transporter
VAASALQAADYLGRFVPAAGDGTALATLPLPFLPIVISPRTLVALTIVVALALVHIRGLGPGRLVQNTLAGVKVGALAATAPANPATNEVHPVRNAASGPNPSRRYTYSPPDLGRRVPNSA